MYKRDLYGKGSLEGRSTQPTLAGAALLRDNAVRRAGPVLENSHASSMEWTEQGMVRLSITVQDLCVIP
jgi:hypothetical protein